MANATREETITCDGAFGYFLVVLGNACMLSSLCIDLRIETIERVA